MESISSFDHGPELAFSTTTSWKSLACEATLKSSFDFEDGLDDNLLEYEEEAARLLEPLDWGVDRTSSDGGSSPADEVEFGFDNDLALNQRSSTPPSRGYVPPVASPQQLASTSTLAVQTPPSNVSSAPTLEHIPSEPSSRACPHSSGQLPPLTPSTPARPLITEAPKSKRLRQGGAPISIHRRSASDSTYNSEDVADNDIVWLDIDDQLPLPLPPRCHPWTHFRNTFTADTPYDHELEYPLRMILDRFGKHPPHAYLVEWDTERCQLSWVWESELQDAAGDLMIDFDRWKDSGKRCTFPEFLDQYGGEYTSSSDASCFFDACCAASYDLGDPCICLRPDIRNDFEKKMRVDTKRGMTKSSIGVFINYLRSMLVPLDYTSLKTQMIRERITSVEKLAAVAKRWPAGRYIVGASDNKRIRHCFVLVVEDDGLQVLDGFSASTNPPCGREPLSNLQWIAHVNFARGFCRGPDLARPLSKRQKKNRQRKRKREQHQAM